MTSVKFQLPVSAVFAGFCLAIGASAQERPPKRCHDDCGEGTRTRKTDSGDAHLVAGCTASNRLGTLTAEEAERYCRWMVRVRKPEPGDPVLASSTSSEFAPIEVAIRPLNVIQPAQIKGSVASVLATDPKGAPGNFTVVWLRKEDNVWRVDRAIDAAIVQRRIAH